MARPQAELRLGAFFNPTGHHVASWRHPQAQADAGINFEHYVEIAQTAERGKFDLMFLADNVCVREAEMEALSRSAQYIANFEPLTLLSALAGVTEPHRPRRHRVDQLQRAVPCGAQVRLARSHQRRPRRLERRHLRHGGRGATTSAATSTTATPSATTRAASSSRSCTALWDSWDDDAFVRDKASRAVSSIRTSCTTLNHKGKHFSVRGPLNIPRPPQGHPVIVQAGASEDGTRRRGAIRRGDLHARQQTLEAAQAFYRRRQGPRAASTAATPSS